VYLNNVYDWSIPFPWDPLYSLVCWISFSLPLNFFRSFKHVIIFDRLFLLSSSLIDLFSLIIIVIVLTYPTPLTSNVHVLSWLSSLIRGRVKLERIVWCRLETLSIRDFIYVPRWWRVWVRLLLYYWLSLVLVYLITSLVERLSGRVGSILTRLATIIVWLIWVIMVWSLLFRFWLGLTSPLHSWFCLWCLLWWLPRLFSRVTLLRGRLWSPLSCLRLFLVLVVLIVLLLLLSGWRICAIRRRSRFFFILNSLFSHGACRLLWCWLTPLFDLSSAVLLFWRSLPAPLVVAWLSIVPFLWLISIIILLVWVLLHLLLLSCNFSHCSIFQFLLLL